MIFRRELAEMVKDGRKTVTRRLPSDNPRSPWWIKRCRYTEGKEFAVNPGRGEHAICRARVVSCKLVSLHPISDAEARAEGCDDAAHFNRTFLAINGKLVPKQPVWRVEFEVIE